MKWYTPPSKLSKYKPSEDFLVYFDWDFDFAYIHCSTCHGKAPCSLSHRRSRRYCETFATPEEMKVRVLLEGPVFHYVHSELHFTPQTQEALLIKPDDTRPGEEVKLSSLSELDAGAQMKDGKTLMEAFRDDVVLYDN